MKSKLMSGALVFSCLLASEGHAQFNSVQSLGGTNTQYNNASVGINLPPSTTPTQDMDLGGNLSVRGTHLVYNSQYGVIDWGSGTTGDLIFRTLSTQGIINWGYTERMIIKNSGYLGLGTSNPGEQLHTTGGVIFQGLTTGPTNLSPVGVDANGKLWISTGGGISNACTTLNFIPKSTTSGNLVCSQIYDDGTSVGIGTTSGFSYLIPWGSSNQFIAGSPAPPTNGTVRLAINGVAKATAFVAVSDERYKKDIQSIDNALEIINKLEGRTYFWKCDEFRENKFNNTKQYGFIAQELQKVVPDAVATDENGFRCVNYDMIIPILVQATKEQHKTIDAYSKEINELKLLLDNLQKQVTELKTAQLTQSTAGSAAPSASATVDLSDKNTIVLNQNVPNPFAESTVISYHIPTDFARAQIHFLTADGVVIKTMDVAEKGRHSLTVFANDLSHGVYTYKLIVDGKVIDTKKMIKE